MFSDGVFIEGQGREACFKCAKGPSSQEITKLTSLMARRVIRYLERNGWIESDASEGCLDFSVDDEKQALMDLQGHSIAYRIAIGPHRGRKVLTLKTLPDDGDQWFSDGAGQVSGFSLHAGVATKAHQRKKLERLCRYITRPALSEKRLSVTSGGKVHYQLKTPYQDGSTHVVFEPLDFMSKLAALVPIPRSNLIRYHGVFAPNNKLRSKVVPGRKPSSTENEIDDDGRGRNMILPVQKSKMSWAKRLKRVFNIDITKCPQCGGDVKVIACIEDPIVINKILNHFKARQKSKARKGMESTGPPSCGARF